MSKYIKQNRLDEKAVSVLSDFFMNKYGNIFDLQFHGIKDNTPDTDGFIRLRAKKSEWQGEYLNQIVFFQLKGVGEKIDNHKYTIKSKEFLDYCKEINLPTILFVVDN